MVFPGESYTYNLQRIEKIYDGQAIMQSIHYWATHNSEGNFIVVSRAKRVSNERVINHSGLTIKDAYKQFSEPVIA